MDFLSFHVLIDIQSIIIVLTKYCKFSNIFRCPLETCEAGQKNIAENEPNLDADTTYPNCCPKLYCVPE